MKIKLAEALLRRKELQEKVNILARIKDNELVYQVRAQRIKVSEGFEDLNADFPKLEVSQVTAEYDHYARALRLVDAAIQQANWVCELDLNDVAMADYRKQQ